ncbi:DNA polymerase I [Candidatus Epulonipiscioides gigas]|nr:DNA polymerase I [Epulopiscium sp. SCG-C07WGA-EpuloA2]
MKILLIDGLSIANRAFYGLPLLSTKEGIFTNAIYGFLTILFSLIEKENPDLLAVTFDVSAPTFRHQHSTFYKSNRKGMPTELKMQIPLLKEIIDAMGIFRIEKEGVEADDLLGTIAKHAQDLGHDIIIVSGDRDLLQVATEKIQIKIPKTKKTGTEIESYFATDVIEKYGVTPCEFIDVKALMGDSSDNIPGVVGVGEKTALKLITQFHSIENLYENIDKVKGAKLKENLVTYKEQAFDSKFLATIKTDVPLDIDFEKFNFTLGLNQTLSSLWEKLEFKKLLEKFKVKPTIKDTIVINKVNIDTLTNLKSTALFVVIEENLIYMGINENERNYFVKGNLKDTNDLKTVKIFFEDDNISKILHESKKIRHSLYSFGINIKGNVFDTAIASYLINPSQADYELSTLTHHNNIIHEDKLVGTGKNRILWKNLDEYILIQQVCIRANELSKLKITQTQELQANNMFELFCNIEMPLCKVLFDMEILGISINSKILKEFGKKLDILIENIEKEIYILADEKFNISSSKQLGTILFEKLDIPVIKKTKTGYSTAADILEKLKDKYEIVAKVLKYRQYTKLKNTYVTGLLKVLTNDNKIHSTFNQTITATGRISSTEPNLQNIPMRFELGREIRKAFVPSSEDYVFLDADYSQIELRVLASMSNDFNMQKAFLENIDIHTSTASEVFGIDVENVTTKERSAAKAVNFGVVYGIGAFSLADDIHVSQKEASEYIESYFEKYPKVKSFLDNLVEDAKKTGYGVTLLNRKRKIDELYSTKFNIREYGKRIAMNMPIQGTSADIIKIAMIRVHKALENTRSNLILTVHDELLLEVHKDEVQKISQILKYEMENAVSLSVPLLVEVKRGDSWFDTK